MNIEDFEHKLAEWNNLPNIPLRPYPWDYMNISKNDYFVLLSKLSDKQYKESLKIGDDTQNVEALDIAYGMMMLGAFAVGLIMAWEVLKYVVGGD